MGVTKRQRNLASGQQEQGKDMEVWGTVSSAVDCHEGVLQKAELG